MRTILILKHCFQKVDFSQTCWEITTSQGCLMQCSTPHEEEMLSISQHTTYGNEAA